MFFFSSRRRHTRCGRDWSSDVCSSDLELLPRGTALVVTKRTNRAGPSYRGRIYVPGFGEGSNEAGGRASSAAVAAALAFVEGLQDAASARGHTLAVASLVKAGQFAPSEIGRAHV